MKQIGILKAMKLCKDYEKMDASKRRQLQQNRLKELVEYARTNSPYFKKLYENVPKSFELEDLPPTNKRELMSHFNEWICDPNITLEEIEKFMEDSANIGSKFKNEYLIFTTSGSTGYPLVCVCDKTANNIMGAISAVRSFTRLEDLKAFIKRKGKSIGIFADEGFYLGNTSIRSRLKTMPWKKKQMAISSALYPVEKIVKQLNEFQPAMIGGYPSNLELLIDEVEHGRLHIHPVIIMTGGEYLSDSVRQRLADTFHCYVQTTYSCTEGGTVACECCNQHFHINDDWLIVEAVDAKGNPVADGVQSDRIFLTNLYNYTQPFIRYEVTDRIIMHHEPCGCGNPSPWIELEGREDDVISFVQNGSIIKIAPLPVYAVLKEVHELRRFQLVADQQNNIELRLEPKEGIEKEMAFEKAKKSLIDYLAEQGVYDITIVLSEKIPEQDPGSGKFKHIINQK